MGCLSTKSDMADAFNKQLAESPKKITANITPEPVAVHTNIQGRSLSVAVFPEPAPATFDHYKAEAYAGLAKAGFLTVQVKVWC